MKRVLCLLAVACSMAALVASADSVKRTGYISESMCGAKHNASAPNAECVKKCISGGSKPVFVDSKNTVWSIDNPDAVKDYYGAKVAVNMTPNPSAKSVHIESIDAAK